MFLRIVGARSAEQFDIIEVKIPFDLNIIKCRNIRLNKVRPEDLAATVSVLYGMKEVTS